MAADNVGIKTGVFALQRIKMSDVIVDRICGRCELSFEVSGLQ